MKKILVGRLHVLPGGADIGAVLIEDPHVRVISFTGSTETDRAVTELAGRHLKRVHLELGGNSALIVLDDTDLEQAISAAATWYMSRSTRNTWNGWPPRPKRCRWAIRRPGRSRSVRSSTPPSRTGFTTW